jgi:hypothetical protein
MRKNYVRGTQVSVAEYAGDKPQRMCFECFLLWRYRLEAGRSTSCNFGRLHPEYVASQNRSTGKRGHKLLGGICNTRHAESLPPLRKYSRFCEHDWMGLVWSGIAQLERSAIPRIPEESGTYRLFTADLSELLYIGETDNLQSRLFAHLRGTRSKPIAFSTCHSPHLRIKCQRLEIENDLIGGYFEETSRPPQWQFVK